MSRTIDVPGYEDYVKLGLDDTFAFHCTQCGKCCIEREDIMLNPLDLFKASKELGISLREFREKYCEAYIGRNSLLPIIRLLPTGNKRRCPLLKNGRCMIHNAKPTMCAMYPLGRFVEMERDKDQIPIMSKNVNYLYKDPECGDKSEVHTVREWLSSFNIKENDEFYLLWTKMQADNVQFSKYLYTINPFAVNEFGVISGDIIYFNYEQDKDFMPQFKSNLDLISIFKEKIEMNIKK